MIEYILKSSACLLLILVFYKLLLERESIHQFKRYYLLFGIMASMLIPFINFNNYIAIEPSIETSSLSKTTLIDTELAKATEKTFTDYLPQVISGVYGIGALIFALRFILNLRKLRSKIKNNTKVKDGLFVNVLLSDLIYPHTFFKYIFLNKDNYKSKQIPKEIFIHEHTHARELHALDIILVELFQIILWFNPLIYLLKHDVKLNHEFLADRAVIEQGIGLENYQNTILDFSYADNSSNLASAFNYSSIKKRLLVMKTTTSKQSITLRTLLILPLLAILVYGFSTSKDIYETTSVDNNDLIQFEHPKQLMIMITLGEISVHGMPTTLQGFVNRINNRTKNWTEDDFKNASVKFLVASNPPKLLEAIDKEFKKTTLYKKRNDLRVIANQDPATESEVEEYNKNAKLYNKMLANDANHIIKFKDLKRLENIYARMTPKQKQSAEPYPAFNIPPPPPPPPAPDQEVNYGDIAYSIYLEGKGSLLVNEKVTDLEGLENYFKKTKEKANASKYVTFKYMENASASNINKIYDLMRIYKMQLVNFPVESIPPPPPPKPQSPLDHIISMANTNAKFYYEGTEISSDKAIDLIKKNDKLNINTKKTDTRTPLVYISTKPVTINIKSQDGTFVINGKSTKTGILTLSRAELLQLKIENTATEISEFKLKIPGQKSLVITGNTLNSDAIKALAKIQEGDALQLFDIKTKDKLKNPPILIEVKDK